MRWVALTDPEQLVSIDSSSMSRPVLLFKHSTRCGISRTALDRLERSWTTADDEERTAYYLDLLRHRDVSSAIAQRYGIVHESPQTLVIREGRCVHHASHLSITYADTLRALTAS